MNDKPNRRILDRLTGTLSLLAIGSRVTGDIETPGALMILRSPADATFSLGLGSVRYDGYVWRTTTYWTLPWDRSPLVGPSLSGAAK